MKKVQLSFAAKICLLYALIGGVGIIFSDRLIGALFVDPIQLTQVQIYKGWLFVLATAVVLFMLLKAEGMSRQSAEVGLHEAEVRLRALIEQMPAAIYTDTPNEFSSNLYSSPQITAITGYTPEEWRSDPQLSVKLIHPEDRQRVLDEGRRATKNREPFHLEYRLTARDGRIVWVHDMATLFCDDKGEPLYWQGRILDITGEKEAVETLRASEARYQTIVEHASDGIFITDQQWKFLDANLRTCGLLGYSREELLGLSIRDLLTVEELASHPLQLQQLLEGQTLVTERTFVRRDGTLLPVELSARLLPDGRLLGIVHDIRERKLTQEALARSEQHFRSLIENSMDAIALYTADGKIIYQSPSSLQILG